MRVLKTWACAAVLAAASPAVAQQTTGTGGTGTGGITSGGSTLGSSSLGSSSLGSSSLGSSSLGSSTLGGGSSQGGGLGGTGGLNALSSQNTQFTDIGITSGSSLQRSNVFSQFYANPYALGLSSSSGSGGFGQPLYGASTTSARGTTGTAGRTGAAGLGRTGGLNNTANQSGILVPLPVQLAYQAQMRFPTAPEPPARLQIELRRAIDAGGLAAPAGVQVLIDANNNVTLRGTVRDDDEARLTEGLVRLTPGVGAIVNELTFPPPPR